MRGKSSAKVPSVGKKRKGKGDSEFAEESRTEDRTSSNSHGKKERLVPIFKKMRRPKIIKEAAQNNDPVVSDTSQEKCTEGNIADTEAEERNRYVEHKDRKDILVDDVSIFHGVILTEMEEKDNSGHLKKGDNLGKSPEEMRMEPMQRDQEQSKQNLLVKTNNYKKTEDGTDLKEGLEFKDQAMKGNTSDNLSNNLEDFTSRFKQNLEKEESCNDIVKMSPHQQSVPVNHYNSKQMNQSESEKKGERDRQQSIQENFAQFKMVVSSKDNNLLKSVKQHQILCDQNTTKHYEMIGKSLSFSENIIDYVNKYSEVSSVHPSKISSPDKNFMDTRLTETTKETLSTYCTNDAETICFDNTNDDTSSIQNAIVYAKDEVQTTSVYSEKSTAVTGQYSDNKTGNTLCNVDAADSVLEKVIQAKGHDIACASFEKEKKDISLGMADVTFHKPIQNTHRSIGTDCAVIDKPKTEMNFDKADANFKTNLTDIISDNNNTNKNVNQQFSFMYTEHTVCQTKESFTPGLKFRAQSDEPHDSHSLQDSAKKSQIQDTNSIHNGCILPDEVSDEMVSYSPIEATEATESQDPMSSYAEGIQVNAAVPEACRDECSHNTDLTDSQLCEMDWSSQIMEEETTQSVEKPITRINLSIPQQRIPDGTSIVKGLVKELSNLNKMLLRTKREIEAARRQLSTLPSQQDKYPAFTTFHK
ncbi:hypothetical protein CHS0354_031775 [Potamilus streckersoni]|uniref:Uncharacterized protein n=1 Tax=Potamilus streckersoni TaxID=2493646 RepID=A0AAE0RXE5_9BIVA|nr:hypothetical protein CHS0354_031775 [Potamilus streckersoni]